MEERRSTRLMGDAMQAMALPSVSLCASLPPLPQRFPGGAGREATGNDGQRQTDPHVKNKYSYHSTFCRYFQKRPLPRIFSSPYFNGSSLFPFSPFHSPSPPLYKTDTERVQNVTGWTYVGLDGKNLPDGIKVTWCAAVYSTRLKLLSGDSVRH